MDRKRKKQSAGKAALNLAQTQKNLKERFLDRSKKFITLVGGPETLKLFPPIFLDKLYECRYPGLKIKGAPESNVPKVRVVQFNKLIQQMLDEVTLPLPNGNEIPLKWYLSEGQTLVDCISEIELKNQPELATIKSLFKDFTHDGKFHIELQNLLLTVICDALVFLSDYNDYVYHADWEMTPYFARFNPHNDVLLHAIKPKKEQIMTADGPRSAIPLGWLDHTFKWEDIKVKPSSLGFSRNSVEIPLTLYVTSHALERLQERINITPGIMHNMMAGTFKDKVIPHRFTGTESQVDFMLADQKVGYFVVKLHGDKLVMHTFLFLTNNTTFEGEKLNRLLSLEVADKKHLEIDTLPSLNAYHISQNETLSGIFNKAGCGSLLKLSDLEPFSLNEQKDKDPESILKYLADAPYFKEKLDKSSRVLREEELNK